MRFLKCLFILGALCSFNAYGQEKRERKGSEEKEDVLIYRKMERPFHIPLPAPETGVAYPGLPLLSLGMAGPSIQFLSSELGPHEVVKGAPFSAVNTVETIQTLADGNRITHKIVEKVYRASDGCVRREVSAHHGMSHTFINCPGGKSYVLDNDKKTVRGAGQPFAFKSFEEVRPAAREARTAGPQLRREFKVMRGAAFPVHNSPQEEDLGTRVSEGLELKGTRSTTTIPAGKIGNERPIEIVNERWYSPELRMVINSRFNDPRFGETTHTMTSISREEPNPELFQVPEGYRMVKEFEFRNPPAPFKAD